MIVTIFQYFAGFLMLLGSAFCLLAAVGILRLPDIYTRMHAASKAGTMGTGLLLTAIAFVAFDGAIILRAIAAFVFLLLTAPVAAHLLARAAFLTGHKPTEMTIINELDIKKLDK
ncbi:MAG: monovalent cation/H(+) antiporter subunit G [Devosiaceae bacterium]|nr:monovalent cation/H(+) antiporter subunit G [Devosiaceae bacterium]